MGYIMDLRKLAGSRPLILVGACVLVFNEHDHLLLQKRTDSLDWGTMAVYEAVDVEGTPTIHDDEGLELRYFPLDEPIPEINPFTELVLRRV